MEQAIVSFKSIMSFYVCGSLCLDYLIVHKCTIPQSSLSSKFNPFRSTEASFFIWRFLSSSSTFFWVSCSSYLFLENFLLSSLLALLPYIVFFEVFPILFSTLECVFHDCSVTHLHIIDLCVTHLYSLASLSLCLPPSLSSFLLLSLVSTFTGIYSISKPIHTSCSPPSSLGILSILFSSRDSKCFRTGITNLPAYLTCRWILT